MKRCLLIACLFCFFYSCNTAGGDPKIALDKFLTAMQNSDFAEAKKYTTEDSQGMMNMLSKDGEKSSNVYKDKKFDITHVTIDGSNAKAAVKFDGNSSIQVSFILKQEHGQWKVRFNLSAMMDMAKDVLKDLQGIDIDKDVNDAIDSIKINEDSLP
jgi:hypothetical protein